MNLNFGCQKCTIFVLISLGLVACGHEDAEELLPPGRLVNEENFSNPDSLDYVGPYVLEFQTSVAVDFDSTQATVYNCGHTMVTVRDGSIHYFSGYYTFAFRLGSESTGRVYGEDLIRTIRGRDGFLLWRNEFSSGSWDLLQPISYDTR